MSLINSICKDIGLDEAGGWDKLKAVSLDDKRQMLQALNMDPKLGGKLRQKMERLMREELRQHKKAKKKPLGDFAAPDTQCMEQDKDQKHPERTGSVSIAPEPSGGRKNLGV